MNENHDNAAKVIKREASYYSDNSAGKYREHDRTFRGQNSSIEY